MAEGDFTSLPSSSAKHFQHLMLKIRKHCGALKPALAFVGIADSTYRKLMDEKFIVKSSAQKILDAYAKVSPYNKEKPKNAKAA